MLNYFNKNYISRYIVLLFIGLVFWLPTFLLTGEIPAQELGAHQFIFSFYSLNPYLQLVSAGLVTFLTALFTNQIAGDNGFSGTLTTWAAFFYLVLASAIPPFTDANNLVVVNFLLIFMYRDLFGLPQAANTLPKVYNAAFMLGLASFFYLPMLFFILVIWYGLLSHRINSWRNFAVALVGILTPYFFLFTWFFITDNLLQVPNQFSSLLEQIFMFERPENYINLVIVILLSILLVVALLKVSSRMGSKNITLRQNLGIAFFSLFISIAVFVVFGNKLSDGLTLLIPSVLIMSNAFDEIRPNRKLNTIIVIFMFFVLINQYAHLFFSLNN